MRARIKQAHDKTHSKGGGPWNHGSVYSPRFPRAYKTHVMDMKNTRLKDCHGLFGVFNNKECNKSLIIVIGELEKRVSSLASYNWRNI